jgi:hypothetical protein
VRGGSGIHAGIYRDRRARRSLLDAGVCAQVVDEIV